MLTEEEKNAGLEGKIIPINIEEQMKSAYIDYSMSVIVSRALPDVRDGLKPVHRRILYDMSAELNLYSDKPTRKSARIVGDVLGKFHPHNDRSVYEAMVRMAQDWSMRYPLVDGQGNFGSMDGDSPAAMRYTEARMQKITDEVMADIDKDTIDWTLNFDDTIPEPTVLPTKIPLLLVNGASGIAVGMATNMAPHNLGEVIDACCAFVDNPEIACEELLKYVKGPDFPTGGIIYGYEGVREALLTGRGRVVMRARTEIEHTASGRECIVITEIPYMVNKAEMIKKIADLINEKKIEGISYINDESDRNGMRIIVILKHDAVASVVLNTLYKNTPLQTSFAVNNIALVNGRPMMLNLLDLVRHFVEHRHDVIVRRTRFDLAKAEKRLHIVLGLLIAQDNIDEIIHIIRAAKNPDLAKQAMMERFSLSDAQASAIIEMRLRALTGLEHDKLVAERNELEAQIAYFNDVLGSRELQMKIVKDELLEVKAKYGDERRVLGKFHPHNDRSVYEAMVRMAQDWSMRYPLVDGQGNFGSMDGDSPAAMRYTEARMQKITDEVMADIDKDTIDWTLNFDDTIPEPTVLPTKIPLLLVNGASGIAVGMATNMAPHNLGEVIDACCAFVDNPEIACEELLKYVKGPDFPTGGIIYGYEGVREALLTGRGRVVMRARTEIEHTASGRECIVITEIPYMVNKAEMIKKIADLINEKKIEGISYINDESDRNGMRIIVILKHDAVASVVLNTLYKNTPLQTSFAVNNIALVNGRPMMLNLLDLVRHFVEHRHDVIVRRTRFDLAKAEKRLHIVLGLLIAQDNIDEIIHIIRAAKNPDLAKQAMMERFSLSDAQASAIIEMRLRALTGLEHDKLVAERNELEAQIAYFNDVLGSRELQMKIVKDELLEVKAKYGDERRSEIVYASEEFNPEDFYADDEMVITISHLGYIKRTPLAEYRTQNRGGVGAKGSATRDEDFIEHIYMATMHNTMLFFTEKGRCYWLKVYEIPEGTRSSKGRAIQNVIQIEPDDKVRAYINVKRLDDAEYVNNNYIIMCTKDGTIKKTKLEAYSRPRQNGVNAIVIREGDQLIEAKLTSGSAEVMIAAREGKAIRFNENTVRPIGRVGAGVRGISLDEGDEVVGMICIEPNSSQDVLVLSENGYGKRTDLDEYRITNRGGKGVKTINITEKTGKLISIQAVTDENDLMIINRSGLTIRTAVDQIRVAGRATQGVRIINLREGDAIASVIAVPANEEEEPAVLDGAGAPESESEENVSKE